MDKIKNILRRRVPVQDQESIQEALVEREAIQKESQ